MRILILEDDDELGSWVSKGLRESGHVVDLFEDGRYALAAASTASYDVMVLDRMTPGLDGLSVLKAVRASGNPTPAIFLTAMGDIEDRVDGLREGGDDYLTKPFAFAELEARVMALGRRQRTAAPSEETVLSAGDLTLDLVRRKCTRGDQDIDLNGKEFQLLEVFLRNKNRVLTRTMLLERVWDLSFDPTTSVVETHLSRLRAKIEKPFGDTLIRTRRGIGYVLEAA